MTKNLKYRLGLILLVLSLASWVMAAPGGGGNKGGGGGGGNKGGGGFGGGGGGNKGGGGGFGGGGGVVGGQRGGNNTDRSGGHNGNHDGDRGGDRDGNHGNGNGNAGHSSHSFGVPGLNIDIHRGGQNSFNHVPNIHGGHPYTGGHGYPGGPGHFGPGGPDHFGPGGYHHPSYGWYHGDWHDHWNRPWGYGPVGWFSVGVVTGAVVWDAPWRWGYYPYYNPYYTEVIVIDNTRVDYSRPIVAAPSSGSSTIADNQAEQLLNASRNAFARGDYPAAMTQINQAIAKKPNDPVLHEFRALILFATKDYKASAAAVYAVLSMGPGWDWATLSSFYLNVETYTAQLRALEQYRAENLDSPEVRFLLAYHYMSAGHPEAAATELKEVVRLNPKDTLSAQLLAGLSGDKTEAVPAPDPEAAPASPVDAASLVGAWEVARSEGESFALNLTADATYSWKYTNNGKSQDYAGAYTVADNLLILKQGGNPVMIGQVKLLDGNRFNFKLVGENPTAPGLTFTKK